MIKSPVRRALLVPPLVVVGVLFLIAATRTEVAAVLYGPAHAAVETWEFVEGTWNLLTLVVLIAGGMFA